MPPRNSGIAARFETRPLYLQVHDRLVNLITEGTWQAGRMIPNEIELARGFGVSVGTMRKALQVLTDRGVLSRRQGRGTIVADQSTELNPRFDNLRDHHGEPLHWSLDQLDVTTGAANSQEEQALQLSEGGAVTRLLRLWRDGSTGTMLLEYCSLPQSRFSKLADDTLAGRMGITQLARHFGILPGTAVETVELNALARSESKLTKIAAGSPVLRLQRTIVCLENIPIEFRIAYCSLGENVSYVSPTK